MIIYNVHIQDFALYYWIVFFLIDLQEVLFWFKHILDINLLQVFVLKYIFSVSIFYFNYFYSFWMKLENLTFSCMVLLFVLRNSSLHGGHMSLAFCLSHLRLQWFLSAMCDEEFFFICGYPSVHNNLLKSTLFLQWPAIHFLSYIKDPHMSRSTFGLSILFHLTRPLCHNYYAFRIILRRVIKYVPLFLLLSPLLFHIHF